MDHTQILELVSATLSDTFLASLTGRIVILAFLMAGAVSIFFLLRESEQIPAPNASTPPSPVRVHVRLRPSLILGKPDISTVAKAHAYVACGRNVHEAACFINPCYPHWPPAHQREYREYLQCAVAQLTQASIDGCIVTVN